MRKIDLTFEEINNILYKNIMRKQAIEYGLKMLLTDITDIDEEDHKFIKTIFSAGCIFANSVLNFSYYKDDFELAKAFMEELDEKEKELLSVDRNI